MKNQFPKYKQPNENDCGPACLKIIAEYFGKIINVDYARNICDMEPNGSTLHGISNAAMVLGFDAMAIKIDFDILHSDVPLPIIVHWKVNHYVVVFDVSPQYVSVSDPSVGQNLRISKVDFLKFWICNDSSSGIALLLVPSENM